MAAEAELMVYSAALWSRKSSGKIGKSDHSTSIDSSAYPSRIVRKVRYVGTSYRYLLQQYLPTQVSLIPHTAITKLIGPE